LGIRKFENNKASQTLILLLSVDKSGFDFQKSVSTLYCKSVFFGPYL